MGRDIGPPGHRHNIFHSRTSTLARRDLDRRSYGPGEERLASHQTQLERSPTIRPIRMALVRSGWRAIKQTYKMIKENHVPIIVFVGKVRDPADAMWQDVLRVMERDPWNFNPEQYQKDFGLDRSRFFIHEGDPLPKDDPEA